jgi:MFS family permease
VATEIRAVFAEARAAQEARRQIIGEGVAAADVSLAVAAPSLVQETAREGRLMWRIVVIIVLASAAGTAIGAALGVLLHVLVGPEGTSGLVIQVVSWAIFAHLLIGMWAGYLLLADRSEREIGRARPVVLTLACANMRETQEERALAARLRELGATEIDFKERAPTPQ